MNRGIKHLTIYGNKRIMFEIRFAVRLFVCFVSFEAIQAQSGNDFTPPTIKDCPPSNIVKFLEVGSYETVSWTVPTAIDSGPVTLESQPIVFPGSFFKVDEPVHVDYTFSDQYGNKASCIFTVSVRRSSSGGDTSAPIIADPCSSTPCMNGRCQPAVLNGGFSCTCNTGFTGDQCQTPIADNAPPVITARPEYLLPDGTTTLENLVSAVDDVSSPENIDISYFPGTVTLSATNPSQTVVVVATDEAGNLATTSFDVLMQTTHLQL